jgi:hypothetical protein
MLELGSCEGRPDHQPLAAVSLKAAAMRERSDLFELVERDHEIAAIRECTLETSETGSFYPDLEVDAVSP